jgi:preprotein translocase subunit SecE
LEEIVAEAKKVTRIKATDDASKKVVSTTASKKTSAAVKATKTVKTDKAPKVATSGKKNVLAAIGAYFKGAWVELKQVRWPNRRATWALTLGVVVFSLFFLGLIVLLDLLFKSLFELVIA